MEYRGIAVPLKDLDGKCSESLRSIFVQRSHLRTVRREGNNNRHKSFRSHDRRKGVGLLGLSEADFQETGSGISGGDDER
jgi:hypothetical protein